MIGISFYGTAVWLVESSATNLLSTAIPKRRQYCLLASCNAHLIGGVASDTFSINSRISMHELEVDAHSLFDISEKYIEGVQRPLATIGLSS
jgi:hypothetical protein